MATDFDRLRRRLGRSPDLVAGLEQLGAETFRPGGIYDRPGAPSDLQSVFRPGPIRPDPVNARSFPSPGLGDPGQETPDPGVATLERPGEGAISTGSRLRPIDQPRSDIRQELSGISDRAKLNPIPNQKEQARINLRYDELKKAPGTSVEQKQNLERERRALVIGSTTPFLESKRTVKGYSPFEAAGIADPAHVSAIRKTNPKAFAEFNKVRAALASATEEDAPSFRREFENRKTEVESIVKRQGAEMTRQRMLGERLQVASATRAREASTRAETAQASVIKGRAVRTEATARKIARDTKRFEIYKKEIARKSNLDEKAQGIRHEALQIRKERLALAQESENQGKIDRANDGIRKTVKGQIADIDKEMKPAIAAFEAATKDVESLARQVERYDTLDRNKEVYVKGNWTTAGEHVSGLVAAQSRAQQQAKDHKARVDRFKKELADTRAQDPDYKPPETAKDAAAKAAKAKGERGDNVARPTDGEGVGLTKIKVNKAIREIYEAGAKTEAEVRKELTNRFGSEWKRFDRK